MKTDPSLSADDELDQLEAPADAPPEPVEEAQPLPAQNAAYRPSDADDGMTAAMTAWTEALRSVERSINDAAEAIRFLRATIQQMAPLWRSLGGLEEALSVFEEQPRRQPETHALDETRTPPPLQHDGEEEPESPPPLLHAGEVGPIEREWQTLRRKPVAKGKAPQWEEAQSPWVPPAEPSRPTLKPVTLVPDDTPAPYAYKVTIEDRKSPVELLQLHKALTSIPSVRNLSLLNYVNGVASISLETTDEIQPPELESAVRKIMKRSCSVVPHESNIILIQVGE